MSPSVAIAPVSILRSVDVRSILPEGLDPPADVPLDIFEATVGMLLAGDRVDMATLAERAGISRATLYRRIPDREHLIGEAVWFLVRYAVAPALEASAELTGADRVAATVHSFLSLVEEPGPQIDQLIRKERDLSMRIFTGDDGPVHAGLLHAMTALLEQEADAGHLDLGDMAPSVLALGIVRIGESFLWPRVFGDVDLRTADAVELVRRLLR